MGTAHVEADLYHPGGDAVSVYWELWINGGFYTSGQGPVGYTFQVGCDVGENTEVRLEAAAVGSDGQRTWAAPSTINTGSDPTPPTPPPTPAPASAPSVGNLSVRYWF